MRKSWSTPELVGLGGGGRDLVGMGPFPLMRPTKRRTRRHRLQTPDGLVVVKKEERTSASRAAKKKSGGDGSLIFKIQNYKPPALPYQRVRGHEQRLLEQGRGGALSTAVLKRRRRRSWPFTGCGLSFLLKSKANTSVLLFCLASRKLFLECPNFFLKCLLFAQTFRSAIGRSARAPLE